MPAARARRRSRTRPARRPVAMAGSRRSTAATGAAAPSSAQLSPPKAIALAPTAACAKTTSRPEVEAARRPRRRPATRTRRRWRRRRAAGSRRAASRAGAWPGTGARAAACGGRRSARSSSRPGRRGAAPWPRAGRRRAGRRSRRGAAPRAPRRCCGRARPRSRAAASGWRARRRRAGAAPTRRRRTSTAAEASPPIISTRPPAMKSMLMCMGGPVMPEVELAGHGEVAGELRVLEVAHARRPHAGLGQPVVEPGGDAAAEVGADRLVDRGEHLQQHEDDADEGRAARPGVSPRCTAPTSAPMATRERGRQQPAQEEDGPPGRTASARSARGRTAKNFHSGRSRSRRSIARGLTGAAPPRGARAPSARSRTRRRR